MYTHIHFQGWTLRSEARLGVFRDVAFQDAGVRNTSFRPKTHTSLRCKVPTPSVVEGRQTIMFKPHILKRPYLLLLCLMFQPPSSNAYPYTLCSNPTSSNAASPNTRAPGMRLQAPRGNGNHDGGNHVGYCYCYNNYYY